MSEEDDKMEKGRDKWCEVCKRYGDHRTHEHPVTESIPR